MKIKERTFLVTGGASGLGEAAVRTLVERGANVIICDLNEENGKKMEEEFGAKVLFCKTNVCDEVSVQKALDAGKEKFGSLHGVINSAGIGAPSRVLSAKGTVHTLKQFNTVISVNLIGTFNVLRLAAAVMAKQEPVPEEKGERGVIINVASVAAFEGQIGQAAYSASKGGIVAMTLPIARELGAIGIRINTVAPGIFGTPLMLALPEKVKASLNAQVPFPSRPGKPSEFADICCTMIENPYLNGTVIRIDGSIRMSAL